jgi:hypothetical protein
MWCFLADSIQVENREIISLRCQFSGTNQGMPLVGRDSGSQKKSQRDERVASFFQELINDKQNTFKLESPEDSSAIADPPATHFASRRPAKPDPPKVEMPNRSNYR